VYDQQAYKKAMEEEEQKQRAAVERRAAELGDSHWVLPAAKRSAKSKARPLLNIVQVGFAQIDFAATPAGSEELPESVNLSSQARFRQFNMKKSKPQKEENDDGSSDSDDGGSDSDSEEDEKSQSSREMKPDSNRGRRDASSESQPRRPRTSVSGRRSEERKRAQQLAANRRKKEVKLNAPLTSISSAGSQGFQRQSASFTCHGCGKPGHKVADCPSKK